MEEHDKIYASPRVKRRTKTTGEHPGRPLTQIDMPSKHYVRDNCIQWRTQPEMPVMQRRSLFAAWVLAVKQTVRQPMARDATGLSGASGDSGHVSTSASSRVVWDPVLGHASWLEALWALEMRLHAEFGTICGR